MNPATRSRRLLVWIILIGSTVIALLMLSRSSGQLADRSTRLLSAADWERDYPGYFWLSDHVILAVEPERPFRDAVYALRRPLPPYHMIRIDTLTGERTPLQQLDARVNAPGRAAVEWRISPDRRWLLAAVGNRRSPEFCAVSVDGVKEMRWPRARVLAAPPVWTLDSRHWVEFPVATAMDDRMADHPGPMPRRAVPRTRTIVPKIRSLDGGAVAGPALRGPFSWPLCVTPENRVLTIEGQIGDLSIYQYGLSPETPEISPARIPIDGRCSLLEAEPSPTADRLALVTVSHIYSPLQEIFRPFSTVKQMNASRRFTLWICKADGSGLHAVGTQRGESLAGVQWKPDGNTLSFFCGVDLRTIRVR